MLKTGEYLLLEPFKGAISIVPKTYVGRLMRLYNIDIANAVAKARIELDSLPELAHNTGGFIVLDYNVFGHTVDTTALQRSGIAIAKASNLGDTSDFIDMQYILKRSRGLDSPDWNRQSVQARLKPVKDRLMADGTYMRYFGWAFDK